MGHKLMGTLCYDQYNNAHFLSYENIQKVSIKFTILSENRKNQKRKQSKNSAQRNQKQDFDDTVNTINDNKLSFTPNINPKSKSIAKAKFQETLSQMNHYDLMHHDAHVKQLLKNKATEEHIKLELQKCTFKPNLISRDTKIKKNDSSNDLNETLNSKSPNNFQNSRKAASTMKNVMSSSDMIQPTSFADLVHNKTEENKQKYKPSPTKTQSTIDTRYANQFQDDYINNDSEMNQNLNLQLNNSTIEQLIRPSRKDIVELANQNLMQNKSIQFQQNLENPMTSRSQNTPDIDIQSKTFDNFDQTSMNSSSYSNIHLNLKQRIPLLYIDVNLGKEKGLQRIILYDDDQPVHIAKQFSLTHNLSEQKMKKLEIMIGHKMDEHRKKMRNQS